MPFIWSRCTEGVRTACPGAMIIQSICKWPASLMVLMSSGARQVFVGTADRASSGSEASTSGQQHATPAESSPLSNGPAPSSLDRVLQAQAGYIEESLQVPVLPLHARSPHAVVRGSEVEVNILLQSLPDSFASASSTQAAVIGMSVPGNALPALTASIAAASSLTVIAPSALPGYLLHSPHASFR